GAAPAAREGTAMEVEFVMRPDDIMAFQEYMADHPPKGYETGLKGPSWRWIVGFGIFSLLPVLCFVYVSMPFYVLFFVLLGPIIFLVFVHTKLRWRSIYLGSVRRGLERNADENAKKLGWKRFTLSREGIT